MKKIWPSEVSIKTSPKFKNSDFEIQNRHPGCAGKFPPRTQVDTSVDLVVDLGTQFDTRVDLRVDLPPFSRSGDRSIFLHLDAFLTGFVSSNLFKHPQT